MEIKSNHKVNVVRITEITKHANADTLVDGPSQVPGAKHMREGIVIRSVNERHVRDLGRVQLKIVSNTFLEKDSK